MDDNILPEPPNEEFEPGGQPSTPMLSPDEIEKLVNDNIKLAYFFANKWRNIPGVAADDIEAQAMAGLVKAANMYDPSKGKFSSYAAMAIKNHLGHMNYHQKEQAVHEPMSLDAPAGGGDEGDDSTVGDKFGDVDPAIGQDLSRSEAAQIIADEISQIREPNRSMVTRWMKGESYRDMQADFKVSFAMIGYIVKDELNKIKRRLADKGILNLKDIWPESVETSVNGPFVYECMLASVAACSALGKLQEAATKDRLLKV
jgi:RNA polymerase sigma factor (sigma-70 family)